MGNLYFFLMSEQLRNNLIKIDGGGASEPVLLLHSRKKMEVTLSH